MRSGKAPEKMIQQFEAQAVYAGYGDSLLSTLRNDDVMGVSKRYEVVGRLGIPVSVIWGDQDEVVPFGGLQPMKKAIPALDVYPIKNGLHSITYTQPTQVSQFIIQSLSKK